MKVLLLVILLLTASCISSKHGRKKYVAQKTKVERPIVDYNRKKMEEGLLIYWMLIWNAIFKYHINW